VPLAEQYGGKISLLHVVQPPIMSTWRVMPGGGHYLAMDMHNVMVAARNELVTMAAALIPPALQGQTVVRQGIPCEEITSAARRLEVELIVISTHGRTGLSRALLGSTAERVVRHAHCPVLAVRRRPGATLVDGLKAAGGRLPWRRILVPIDFSKTSLGAFDVAVPLARDQGARLFLLSVIEPAAYATGMEGTVIAVPDAKLVEDAKASLPGLARRFVPSTLPTTSLVGQGKAFDVITRLAKEKAIDLIVLTSHGRTGLG